MLHRSRRSEVIRVASLHRQILLILSPLQDRLDQRRFFDASPYLVDVYRNSVSPGVFQLTINGTPTADLSNVASSGEVQAAINDVLDTLNLSDLTALVSGTGLAVFDP